MAFIDEAEKVALAGLKAMQAYLAYEGSNKEYLNKAKIGGTAVASYTKHYASLTNREALKLAVSKQKELAGPALDDITTAFRPSEESY